MNDRPSPTYRPVRPDTSPSPYGCSAEPDGHEERILAHAERVARECPWLGKLNERTDDERRLAVARYLRRNGETTRHRLRYAVRVGREKLLALITHPWFAVEGAGVRLTVAGWRELRKGLDPKEES